MAFLFYYSLPLILSPSIVTDATSVSSCCRSCLDGIVFFWEGWIAACFCWFCFDLVIESGEEAYFFYSLPLTSSPSAIADAIVSGCCCSYRDGIVCFWEGRIAARFLQLLFWFGNWEWRRGIFVYSFSLTSLRSTVADAVISSSCCSCRDGSICFWAEGELLIIFSRFCADLGMERRHLCFICFHSPHCVPLLLAPVI